MSGNVPPVPRVLALLLATSVAAGCSGGSGTYPAAPDGSGAPGAPFPPGSGGAGGGSVAVDAAMQPPSVPGRDAGSPVPADAAAGETAAPPTPGSDGGAPDRSPPVATDGGAGPGAPAPGSFLPRPRGACPDFTAGMVTFRPGAAARQARVWISPEAAAMRDGPLVFYWYGTNGQPEQAQLALSAATISAITGEGGIVVAPVHDPAAGTWPWFLVSGTREDDIQLADEVVACAVEKVGIDRRRIHSLGFSAGAIMTVQLGYRRSGYMASVATYSGAKAPSIPDQDPTSKLAAMIFHGGPGDRVGVSFQQGSEMYRSALTAAGRFSVICNHGLGHRIPTAATASVWRFLQDHPFGTTPSPWAAALPPGVPSYCTR